MTEEKHGKTRGANALALLFSPFKVVLHPLVRWVFETTLFLVLIAIIFLGTAREIPLLKDQQFFIVMSGSMEPHIRTGSLVLVTKNAGEPQVGEVWTFLTPRSKQVTTHRILNKRVEKDKLLYSTQGDANDTPDPWILENGNMIGKVKFSVPFAGYLAHYAKTPQGFFLIAVVPGLLLIIDEIWKIKKIIELNHQNEVLKLKKELEETKEKVKKQG